MEAWSECSLWRRVIDADISYGQFLVCTSSQLASEHLDKRLSVVPLRSLLLAVSQASCE